MHCPPRRLWRGGGSAATVAADEAQRQIEAITGVPYTTFDGDQSDYRNYSEAQFETRIQGLVEVMKARKEAKENG